MKQIRRAEMENERLENRDNHNARDDNYTKNFTTEAEGSEARADNLATEAKGGKARTEENSNKSEAATEMINEQGPITHSTCALMSRHCVHTCISSGIPSAR